MEGASPMFILSYEDVGSTSYSYSYDAKDNQNYADVFHHKLPSGSLLETDDVIQQFLASNEPLEEPDLGPTTLRCEICQKKFDNAKKYYGHLRVHSKSKAWVCDKCPDEKFSTKQQLMKHSLTHKPLEKIWKCPQCPMIFEVLFRLQQHLFAKHLNYRPHKCDKCPKTFNKLSDLKKHQYVHADVKPFECKFCPQRFTNKSNMERHILKHTDEKPYCCTGCGTRFQQVASLNRHHTRCTGVVKQTEKLPTGPRRLNYCRVCGMAYQYKSALVEHYKQHHNSGSSSSTTTPTTTTTTAVTIRESKPTDEIVSQSNADSKAVDNIVEDILSVEADYSVRRQNEINQAAPFVGTADPTQTDIEKNAENMMHIEFLKEMNQLHNLDDELFYNDLDLDSLYPPIQVFNTNETDAEKNAEVLFDFTDGGRSMDQEIMNAIYHSKAEHLTDEFLNVPDDPPATELSSLPKHVAMNECKTIFETDVDLDASTSLAANLNQLIGENNVQYVATEDDDTFIISLNSAIDAEKLTDMLSIANEAPLPETAVIKATNNVSDLKTNTDSIVIEIPEFLLPVDKRNKASASRPKRKPKVRKSVLFICRVCSKVFKRKENYKSHIALHDPSLRRHKCEICNARFSYRSSLNKHVVKAHNPRVFTPHTCPLCDKTFTSSWMLKVHKERDHELLTPFACDTPNCNRKFYKKYDLVVHKRSHTGERPHSCADCDKTFIHVSHLRRHVSSSKCRPHKKRKAKSSASVNVIKEKETTTSKSK